LNQLKEKTISGFIWSFIDSFANQLILFAVGIILARLLTPHDFGLIGLTVIFTSLADSLVNSGFSQALIRKTNCSEKDYSTVFYFNLFVSLILFLVLFFGSQLVATFFNEPKLEVIIKALASVIFIDALSVVQRAILTKKINFKFQAKTSVLSSLISGVISIILAYSGFGVWSLVYKLIIQKLITTILLWSHNRWLPLFEFSIQSFKSLYKFGYKLLIGGLLDTLYQNIYYIIIGKYFSPVQLGLYTRADQFSKLPTSNLNSIFTKVAFPVLSQIQDNRLLLKEKFQKLLKVVMFISFFLMFMLAAISKPMVIILIGQKWQGVIIYLQLLCLVGVQLPLNSLNLLLLQIKGRSDIYLRIEIIKKVLASPILLLGVFFNIEAMIISMAIISLAFFFLNSNWTIKYIPYNSLHQIKDIGKSFIICLISASLTFSLSLYIFDLKLLILLQLLLGIFLLLLLCNLLKLEEYYILKKIIFEKIAVLKSKIFKSKVMTTNN
jgi:teichuronic acid exporter